MRLFEVRFSKGLWWSSHEVAMYFIMYTYSYFYVNYDYDTGFYVMMMLRSTTSPYGRPMIDVAYGEMIFLLHRDCMGDDSSRRVIGVSAWCIAHVRHTRVNTSVGSKYIIFWFSWYQTYMYYVFKIYICSIKEHWWSLTLSWPDKVQRMFSTVQEF